MNTIATAILTGEDDPVHHGTRDPVPWWSFTKTVLATAVLRLVERGALRLTDLEGGERYTLGQLLRHEAGMPDYGSIARYHENVAAGQEPWPVPKLLAAVKADRLQYEPGNGWAYSNVGYLKVAQIVERASGMPLARALASLVFEPCNLSTARLALLPSDLDGVQMGSAPSYHPGWVYHGLVTGTVADAARLLHTVMSGRLLHPDSLASMLEGRALPEHRSATHPDPAYGLGLMLSASNPLDHPIGHTGGGPGSGIAVYSRRGRTVAVWTALPSDVEADVEAFRLLS